MKILAEKGVNTQEALTEAAQAVANMESVSVLAAGSFGSAAMADAVTRADAAQKSRVLVALGLFGGITLSLLLL